MYYNEIKIKLSTFKIGIAGAGGLGSNCAVALVRAGIKNIIIADFDIVDESNLNRQYFFKNQIGKKKVIALSDNLVRINENINIQAIDKKLVSDDIISCFSDCDVIVEAFDNKEAKQMIIETISEKMPNKPIVAGSGIAGWGNNNSIKTKQFDNLYICGDGVSEASDDLPTFGPRVAIVANMQANQVLEILLGKMNYSVVN
jgi:sulfur carrier protein ThiS adenylyltransferase